MDQKNRSRTQKTAAQARAARKQPAGPPAASGTYRPVQRGDVDEAARRRQLNAQRKRRRRRLRMFTMLAGLILAAVGLVLAVTVLFKVTDYRVENPVGYALQEPSQDPASEPEDTENPEGTEGADDGGEPETPEAEPVADLGPYTEQQVIDALAVAVGYNIFGFSAGERERLIQRALPELERVRVRRSLPGTVVVQVEPAVAAYTVAYGSGWAVLSESCRVMRMEDARPAGLVELQGIEAAAAQPGVSIQLAAAPDPAATSDVTVTGITADEALSLLLAGLEENDLLDGLTAVQMDDLNEFSFVYEDRLRVLLGTCNHLDYKLQLTARCVLGADGLLASDRGILDVSHMNDGGTINPVFAPGSIEPVQPEPTPQPEASPAPEG